MREWDPLREAVRNKQALEQELHMLQVQQQTLSETIASLTEQAAEKQERVEQLKGFTVARILSSLKRNRESDMEQALLEANYTRASLESSQVRRADVEERIREKQAQLDTMVDAETAYFQALTGDSRAAERPGYEKLVEKEESLHRLTERGSLLHESGGIAEGLLADLRSAATVAQHGDVRTTNTGVRYNTRMQTLDDMLPRCQQGLETLYACLHRLAAEPEGASVEAERLSGFLGEYLTAPLSDFTLNQRLWDAEYQVAILRKQIQKADAECARQTEQHREEFRDLLFRFHDTWAQA